MTTLVSFATFFFFFFFFFFSVCIYTGSSCDVIVTTALCT